MSKMKHLSKLLSVSIILFILASCSMMDQEPVIDDFRLSSSLSIFVSEDGKVGVSTLVNDNYDVMTEYWIDGKPVQAAELKSILPAGNTFRTTIDDKYFVTYVVKGTDGVISEYKFFRNYIVDFNNKLFYTKNDNKHSLDTTAIGVIQSVDLHGSEVFAGIFGEQIYDRYYGTIMRPTKAFYMDGSQKINYLPLPNNYFYFNGVSAIHKSGDDVYVAGLMDFPMYWKNKEMVRLSSNDRYGEVSQIITHGEDVYAVGFYDKANAYQIGHTACYWKNGELVELENAAIANAIFIDKNGDVYVAGAKGVYEKDYKACYWKNGERILLLDSTDDRIID